MIPLPSLIQELAPLHEALDAAPAEARVHWSRSLSMGELKALWRLAQAADAPLSVDEMVGDEGVVVTHVGKNSLPVFCNFEKRLVRAPAGIQGYNHNPGWLTRLIGPGHFTVRQESDTVVLFDYIQLAEDVPSDFPPLAPNVGGLPELVYGHMLDRVRRVSAHATIGRAWKKGKAQPAWFMLVRDDGAVDAAG